MSFASTKRVNGYLRQVPDEGHHRDCVLAIETRNHGAPDQSMSLFMKLTYEIADPADDFPDGNYEVSFDGGSIPFVKSGGRYSAV